jgi:hypothetical protein
MRFESWQLKESQIDFANQIWKSCVAKISIRTIAYGAPVRIKPQTDMLLKSQSNFTKSCSGSSRISARLDQCPAREQAMEEPAVFVGACPRAANFAAAWQGVYR